MSLGTVLIFKYIRALHVLYCTSVNNTSDLSLHLKYATAADVTV